jgi:hypothetical protein
VAMRSRSTSWTWASSRGSALGHNSHRGLSGGRTAYWRDGTVVIRNPKAADGGTAFQPTDGYDYFLGLH